METSEVSFSFTWHAMQLLGKSLYSNAWSAVSELVANGFDAGATTVRVLIDVHDKSASTIEIMDNGSGMDTAGITTYAKVGYDRRLNESEDDAVNSSEVMGRKGIGKLAALYLTDDYSIQTKQSGIVTTWQIDRGDFSPDSIPTLKRVDNNSCQPHTPDWAQTPSGTIIVMRNVNLKGLGEAAFDALSSKLANQFLISSMDGKSIELAIQSQSDQPIAFRPVEKSIAFRNMFFLANEFEDGRFIPEDISAITSSGNSVKMPLRPNKGTDLIERSTVIANLHDLQEPEHPIEGYYAVEREQVADMYTPSDYPDTQERPDGSVGIPYRLTGWIGLHATIRPEIAQMNDARFEKNKFYNPAQIRLYVRNKLASEELLSKLGITGAFANYIEGELSFDLLDNNLLPDIATSNRQGFDELDGRWVLLKNILRPIVRRLMSERQKIADELNREMANRQKSAKSAAFGTIQKELRAHPTLSDEEKEAIGANIISQFQGEVDLNAKEDYKVFLSHRSTDKIFVDFIYYFLIKRGASKEDFFYTSGEDPEKYEDPRPLADQIKKNIVSDNTLIAYFTSPYFLESQYCLFEGGAGWATRSVDEYLLLSTTHDGIPEYLTNDKQEMITAPGEAIKLDSRTYHIFRRFINRIIEHINMGRKIKELPLLEPLSDPRFPDKVELDKLGKDPRDYMDPMFLEYWTVYIENELPGYEIRPGHHEESDKD